MENHRNVDTIQEVLHRHHLKVNTDKIEYTTIKRDLDDWKKSKKVGSLLGDKEEIQRRKNQPTKSLNRLNKLWNDKKIKVATKA